MGKFWEICKIWENFEKSVKFGKIWENFKNFWKKPKIPKIEKKIVDNRPEKIENNFFCQIPKVVSENKFDVQYRNNDPECGGVIRGKRSWFVSEVHSNWQNKFFCEKNPKFLLFRYKHQGCDGPFKNLIAFA